MTITPADLEAAADVFNQLAEEADGLSVEDAVELHNVLGQAIKASTVALGMLKTQLLSTLESPRLLGDRLYYRRDDGKWRPEHDRLAKRVIDRALVDDNGEIDREPLAVATRAVALMTTLYVEPSKMPKLGPLEELGLVKTDVAHWQKTGMRVVVENVGAPEEDGG